MFADTVWRKLPLDFLTNETMTYIESQMPAGYEYAPFMFYQAALRKADDDGIFDLEDGLIFARLMRVTDVKIVFKVAQLMAQRKVIYHISAKSNKCLIADWNNGTSKPRTLAERRDIVLRQIEEAEKAKNAPNFLNEPEEIEQEAFFYADDDKNAKNVTKNTFYDKNTKNVEPIERKIDREIETKTHTQIKRNTNTEIEREKSYASAESLDDSAPASQKETALAETEETKKQEKKTSGSSKSKQTKKNEQSEPDKSKNVEESERKGQPSAVDAILESFFINNCFGYDPKKGKKGIAELVERINGLETADFSAEKIAQTLCNEFKIMHDSPGQWENIPLSPTYMLKNAVWEHLLTYAAKKLTKDRKKRLFEEEIKQVKALTDAELKQRAAEIDEEYMRYGIDPEDPARALKLLKAKQQPATEKPPSYEEAIF